MIALALALAFIAFATFISAVWHAGSFREDPRSMALFAWHFTRFGDRRLARRRAA